MAFNSMLHLDGLQSNVPCSTTNSALRSFYNQIRDHDHCSESVSDPRLRFHFKSLTDEENQVIRMIYFANVLANFEAVHKKELSELANIEAEHQPGFPELDLHAPFACGTESGLTRPKFIEWMSQLEAIRVVTLWRRKRIRQFTRISHGSSVEFDELRS